MIGLGLRPAAAHGINAIIYYSNSIFAAAGLRRRRASASHDLGDRRGQRASTFIAIAFIDGLGRRPLLIAGLIGMALSLAVVGLRFGNRDAGQPRKLAGVITLGALVVFIISFASRLGRSHGRSSTRSIQIRSRPGGGGGDSDQLGRGVSGQRSSCLGEAIGQATLWLFAASA